jgi:nucleoside-diphosphate-sugar epimerase
VGGHLLVAGARGLVGRATVEHFEALGDWRVSGLARGAADFKTRAAWLRVDLQDRAACEALGTSGVLGSVTHLCYAALFELPSLACGWFDPVQIETNRAMLENLLDALEAAGAELEHVSLLQGTKAYGVHVGRQIPVPAKERWPRDDHANFYFEQEDLLNARAAARGFGVTVFRPQIVFGTAVGSPMNPTAALGAFASIQKARGQPLFHPGAESQLAEAVDAALVAEAVAWAATEPRCAGETYNLTNGDALLWRDLFPWVARHYGLELAEPHPCSMADEMPKHAPLWSELVVRHGLRYELDALIGGSWQYADLLWANPQPPPRPTLVSTIKARQHGFHACRDTEDMLIEQLERMEREKLLPPAR